MIRAAVGADPYETALVACITIFFFAITGWYYPVDE